MSTGTVKWFNETKSYGFTPDRKVRHDGHTSGRRYIGLADGARRIIRRRRRDRQTGRDR